MRISCDTAQSNACSSGIATYTKGINVSTLPPDKSTSHGMLFFYEGVFPFDKSSNFSSIHGKQPAESMSVLLPQLAISVLNPSVTGQQGNSHTVVIDNASIPDPINDSISIELASV